MKSNRKKRIIAAVLCMVMVLSSNISALAGEELFIDTPATVEEMSSEPVAVSDAESEMVMEEPEIVSETEEIEMFSDEAVSEPLEVTESNAPSESTMAETEIPAEVSFSDGESEETPSAEATPEEEPNLTPEQQPEAESQPETDFGDGAGAEEQILSGATELKQEFADAEGNVIQKVTANLPVGAFAAETSAITMEVNYLDTDSANYMKSMMTERVSEGMELGSYVFFDIQFKVNGEKAEALQPITITIEGSGLNITDTKKATVFYFDPADAAVEGDKDELKEIPQRAEVLESLQAAGQGTENIEDYDLSEITFREDGTTDKVIFEGRKSTIYGCYTEEVKPAEETPEEEQGTSEEPETPGTEVTTPETPSEIEIISDEVNLRTEPNAGADNVAAVAYTGERFPLLENVQMEDALWYKIQYTYPETGETAELYVRSDFAKIVETDPELTDGEAVDMIPVDPVKTLNYSDDQVDISVSAYQENVIPEDAELQVTPITADSEEYANVEQKVQEKVAEEQKEVAGFLAYDITFVDPEGNKLEPNGEVKVSMNYKPAAIPESVQEAGAENTEVSVLHLEENAAGEVQQVVDMASENQVETLNTTEANEIQTVEMTTESFSVFTITWTYSGQSKFTITAKYVDTSGKKITVENPETTITMGNNETIDLEKYWRDADGYSQGIITVDSVGGTEITGLQSSSADKNFIITWTEYYIKYKAKDSTKYTDWLKAGKKLEGEKTEGTIYFVYNSPTDNISLNIVDNIIEDGSLTSKISGTYESEISGYEWYSSDSENGTYTLVEKKNFRGGKTNISDDGAKLYPAFDDGAQKWYKVKVTYADGATVESAPYQVPYFDSLQNGGFEKVVNAQNYVQYSNSNYKKHGGVWQTTGTNNGKDIEIINTEYAMNQYYNWYGQTVDAESESRTVQFAELNCEAAGALYQDVLTMEGQVLNYWLSHRARGNKKDTDSEYDTMYLVIMPTKDAEDLKTQNQLVNKLNSLSMKEKYGENHTEIGWNEIYNNAGTYVARITSDDQNWHNIVQEGIGRYIPTSSLTRFFFMAGYTDTESTTEGNFLDAVGFGQDLPKPEEGKFNFTIEKHFEGLGNADLTEIRNKIQFRISVKNNGTDLTDDQVKTLLGIESVVIKGSDMTADLNGNLTKSFVDCQITNSNDVYEITVTEGNAELSSYVVNSSYTTTVSQNNGEPATTNEEGVTATVSGIKGQTGAKIDFTNTYESTNYKRVNFTKVWDDNSNDFETRPDSLEVTLHGSVSYVDESGETVTKNLSAEELGVDATRTLNQAGKWKTSWKVPVYYEVTHSDGTIAKIKIHYTVTEGAINSDYVYEAGELRNGTGEGYSYDEFKDVTITGDGQAVTQPASTRRSAKAPRLMTLSNVNENELGEPNHRKYIVYNEATGDYTLNLDVTGKKGEAKGVDVLFVIDTSGSMSDNNLLRKVKNLLTEDNGVVDKILGGENNVNSVAYVSFAGKSETKTSSWYGANGKGTLKSQINNLRATGGTNWTYAMMKADEKLAERANSGNEKVMIFLSDGEPTYSIRADGSQYGKGSSTRDVYYTEAIAEVTGSTALKSAQKYSVYLTSGTKKGMSTFATGTGAELVDGTQLETALSTILNKIIPTYTDVSIEDTLSQYVEFTEGNNPTITVYKDNERLPESAYSVEGNGKTVKVSFNDELEDGATYRISFRVKPSQEANDKYVNVGGYPDKGDAGTGTTSAGQKGFYSNDEAKLTYSIKGTENNNLTATYQKPVVQITTHSLTFEKKWNKPQDVTTPDSVTLNVAYTDGTNEQITLTQEHNWIVTKNNVPVTKKIQSVTEVALNDYTPSYAISEDGTKATVTNSYSKITTKNMTVRKIWSGNGPQTEVTVSLYQRKNDNSAEQLYKSVVLNEQNGWTHTWNDLPSKDWLGENNFSYAVREEKIPENYTSNISYKTEGDTTTVTIDNVYDTNCADENFYIANKLQTIPLTVTKTWSDGNNAQGERPESLGVTVQEGGHKLQFTLSADDNWTKNVRVPKRSDSNYTATEDLRGIANYTQVDSSVNATDNAVYVSFTNQIKTTSVTVNKVWVDGNPENRPGSIEFVLKRNGEVYDHYTLSKEDNDGNGNSWTKVIEGLPVSGSYAVEELDLGTDDNGKKYDYNSNVTGSQDSKFTITNTLNWHIIKTSESLAGEPTVNLADAEFELKKDNKVIATGISDSGGVVQWNSSNLTSLNGNYQLVETKAPNGYVIHEKGWTLTFENGLLKTVQDNNNQKGITVTYDAVNGACVRVTNAKIYTLPSTGGNGIFGYMISGVALMMAAMFILYKMRRKGVLRS